MRQLLSHGLRAVVAVSVAACTVGGLSVPSASAVSRDIRPAHTFTTPALPEGNARFLDAAVRDLLGRASTPADRARWLGALDDGQPRAAFAGDVARTPEWTSVVVTDLYAQVFDRAPDTSGLTHWSAQLGAGLRTADLAAHLYGSSEFYTASGSTPGGYVDRLYLSVLHRLPDAGGHAYWVAQLRSGTPRSLLARLIFLSLEGNGERVDTLYGRLLDRASDPGGRAYWSQVLVDTDDLVLAGLVVGSAEYLAAAQTRFQSGTVTTGLGTTVLVAPHVVDLVVAPSGYGSVTVGPAGPVPEVHSPLVVSRGGADGFAVGFVSEVRAGPDGSTVVRFRPADLADVFSSVDVRSTVELPRDAVVVPAAPSGPTCDAGSAELDAGHRLTSDARFDGRLTFDRDTDTYDVAAVVSVASNLTATMSADARTSGCAMDGATWSAHWPLAVAAGPIDIPMVVDIDGTYDLAASFDAAFRTSTTASVPCRIGFTADRDATGDVGPLSALGCGGLDGRSSAEPGIDGNGQAVDHTDLSIEAGLGTPLTGVFTSGHLQPTVTTSADVEVTPWWTVDLAVDGSTTGKVLVGRMRRSATWDTTRLVDRRLAQAPDGSLAPRSLAVATGWLRRGAVGAPYVMDLAATGGLPGYTWTAGGLPAGLTVHAGRISGTPTTAGTPTVTLTATDAAGRTANRSVPLEIGASGSSTAFDRITHGDGIIGPPQLSGNGRHLVFPSSATNLVPGDDNGAVDLFTFDLATGATIRLTKGAVDTFDIRWEVFSPLTISADGRYIAYESPSVPRPGGEGSDVADIFLWDRTDGSTIRLTDGDGHSGDPSMTADGSQVAFDSEASDLVAGETRSGWNVYVWTRRTGSITWLSSGSSITLSGDGSHATLSDQDGLELLDRNTGIRTMVAAEPLLPVFSADGRFVAYLSRDTSVYRWDRTTGLTTNSGPTVPGLMSISSDGSTVAFEELRYSEGMDRSDLVLWHADAGTFERLASGIGPPGSETIRSMAPSISGDGSSVAFNSETTHLVPNDTNGLADLFVWRRPPTPG